MITGFNTDVEHGGVVYHVQTEDKGLDSPIILSLVYSGGAILASKRSPYNDLIAEGFTDEALSERLKRQHRLICAAIHSGRLSDLKKMAAREGDYSTEPQLPEVAPESAHPAEILVAEVIQEESPSSDIVIPIEIIEAPVFTPPGAESFHDVIEATTGEEFELSAVDPTETIRAEIIEHSHGRDGESTETFDIIELEEIPADTIQRVPVPETESEFTFEFEYEPQSYEPQATTSNAEPQYDDEETIVKAPGKPDYPVYDQQVEEAALPSVQTEDGLMLTLLDEEEFYSGDNRMLRVLVSHRSGDYDKPLANAPLSVKILGTTFRPLIYSIKTERDGVAAVTTQIPHFTSGRAAVLIKVSARGEAAELRRIIHPVKQG